MSKTDPFPRSLRRYRKEHQMTLQALAAEFDVDFTTVWKWERGIRRPQPIYVGKLSKMTGVPALEILGVSE